MNDRRRYVFVGNRGYVLKEMINKNLNIVGVWIIENSFLHKKINDFSSIQYEIIKSKNQLIQNIHSTNFDVLVSNGCKYVLPIKSLKRALYINIHPSYLPDLRGKDPINGAVLLGRNSGATCHIMDDGIDTGKIISRELIELTNDIDSALLFQLAFQAEVLVFNNAYSNNFRPLSKQPVMINNIYYTTHPNERLVDFNKGVEYIIRQAKAFGYKSKGVFFKINNVNYRFFYATEITNPFVKVQIANLLDRQIYLSFEDSIIFKLDNRVMRFYGIENMSSDIKPGDIVENGDLELA